MAEFECPFQAEMLQNQSKKAREIVIRGIKVKISADEAGGNLNRGCLLQAMNESPRIYPGLSDVQTCPRCNRNLTFPKGFLDRLANNS